MPIRLRVTLAFAAAMLLVLVAVGSLIYIRYRSELDASIDRSLRSRAGDVTSLLQASGGGHVLPLHKESLGEDNFAQVLTPTGQVVDTTRGSAARSVLTASDLDKAVPGPTFVERDQAGAIDGPARLIATSARPLGKKLIVVVATGLDDRNASLRSLATLLLIGGSAALLLASLAGYAAVAASLRPVEAIRRRAAEISSADTAQRLPVPDADDELRRLGETLNEMLARLEAALERERSFVDDASHELRTPLAMQKAELEVALRHAESPEELRDAISSAIDEVDRLSRLAEDLLVLARSDKGRLEVRRARVDVAALIGLLRDRFSGRAESTGRRLDAEPADGLELEADQLRLEQALGNLIDNALRHGAGPVLLQARPVDGRIELHVIDSGPGLPTGFAGQAFQRFSRPDDARSGEGTGLGLAIVEAIALAHGGEAGAASRDGGGADVWIAIPRA